jgi:integrase
MALELKATSGWWYGRFLVNGELHRVNLGVRIQGRRPASITETGDTKFEQTRGKAQAKHDQVLADIRSKKTAEELAQRVMEIKMGTRVGSTKLAQLADAWEALPRKRTPTAQYIATSRAQLCRFVAHMTGRFPGAKELASVQAEHVDAFLKHEEARGISGRTWNIMRGLLKGVFRKLEPAADAYRRYLLQAPQRVEETVHRQPFTADEINTVLEAAKADPVIRPVIVTALCTAMRRTDCALLRWDDVDLKEGFITIKTGKTGETAEIPILPKLREELTRQPRRLGEFVFPEAAALAETAPHQLTRRLKTVLNRAGFVDEPTAKRVEERPAVEQKPSLPTLPAEEIRRRGLEAIERMKMITAKRQRMREIFRAYLDGKGLPTVARELGLSKSTVSLHLHEIEREIGAAVVRWQEPPAPSVVRGFIHAKNGTNPRLKRGSLKGWHSFRTTFITLALSAGVPMELVRRVTGHTTVEVVLKHYFRPGREQFREAMLSAMPKLLTTGTKSREEQIQEIVSQMTADTLKQDKERLLKLVKST